MAAKVADLCATVEFAGVNLVLVLGWAVLGLEPFPYNFLTLMLSVEAILLTVAVLVQNRLEATMQSRQAEADVKNNAIAAETSLEIKGQLDRIEKRLRS